MQYDNAEKANVSAKTECTWKQLKMNDLLVIQKRVV